MSQREDLLRILPMEDLEHGVGPRDEEQLHLILGLPAELLKGVHRIGGAPPFDLEPGHREPRVAGRGDHGHQVAVLGRGDLPIRLHPGLARGDEDHLVQAEGPQGRLGGDEVAVMDGVEGAAHDPQALGVAHQPDCRCRICRDRGTKEPGATRREVRRPTRGAARGAPRSAQAPIPGTIPPPPGSLPGARSTPRASGCAPPTPPP